MPSPSLLQRLKERKLVQWGVAYLAGAWLLYEVSATVGGHWNLSDGFFQGLFVVLAIGFFVVLILAWYHGEKGRQRVSGPELLMVAALLVVAGVALSMLPGGEARVQRPNRDRGGDDRPVIAVLPLENLSPDPENDFFAAGVQEDLTAKLEGVSTLAVISRTSADHYRDRENRPPLPQIASKLGADFLLEGSARIVGDSVRITVQLIEGATDVHLWAEDYTAPYSVEDYVRLQSDMVQRIASDLRASVSPEDKAWLEAVPTGSLEAFEAYLRGNEAYIAERQELSILQEYPSVTWYEEAVSLDPSFALAHARLALSLTHTELDQRREERAKRSAERALALAGEIPEARLALARYYSRSGNQEESNRQVEMAAKVAPDHMLVLRALAGIQRRNGDLESSIQTLIRAERLDPLDPFIPRSLGFWYSYFHQYDAALEGFAREAALSETPSSANIRNQARVHLLRGEHGQARVVISELLQGPSFSPYTLIPSVLNMVVLRYMTLEERQASFAMYPEWASEVGFVAGCSRFPADLCLRRAIHEQEVGSAGKAKILWDSLRVAFDDAPPPTEHYDYGDRALILMAVGDEESAVEMARTGVRLFAPEGCKNAWGMQSEVCEMLARVLAHFDEKDEAIDLLEELLPAPSFFTVHILEIDPIWDPLRDHPRFQALLEKYEDDVEH